MIKDDQFYLSQALIHLVPEKSWAVRGDTYDEIEWFDNDNIPSEKEVHEKAKELKDLDIKNEYKYLRLKEYPDFRDYLDGIVKGDQDQINAYISACLAVKEKYPKPE